MEIRKTPLVFAILYFLTNSVLAHAFEANFWKEREASIQKPHVQLASLPKAVPAIPTPSKQFGSIRGVSNLKTKKNKTKTIIHIQDIHQNQEAQANIGATIQQLIDDGQIDLVALEGAFEPMDLSAFRNYSNQQTIRKVANYLLKENQISGPLHTLLTSQKAIPSVVGVDDHQHYHQNVEAYKSSTLLIDDYRKKWEGERKGIEKEKEDVFNAELLAFDQKVQAYRDGTMGMGNFIVFTSGKTKGLTTHLQVFVEALELERSLDFKKVERERSQLLERLLKDADSGKTEKLIRMSFGFRMGRVNHSDFYRFIRKLCDEDGVSLSQYPALSDYVQYVLLADSIQSDKLFEEVLSLEKEVYRKLANKEAEKKLVQRSRVNHLIGKLINFSLTPKEWKEYQLIVGAGLRARPNAEDSTRLGGHGGPPLRSFEEFYIQAEHRDKAMAQNLVQAMEKYKAKIAVLVTGGFHSKGIREAVQSAKCKVQSEHPELCTLHFAPNIITFVPKISKVETKNGSSYLSVFTQEKTPLEELFEGEKLFLARLAGTGIEKAIGLSVAVDPQNPTDALKELTPHTKRIAWASRSNKPSKLNPGATHTEATLIREGQKATTISVEHTSEQILGKARFSSSLNFKWYSTFRYLAIAGAISFVLLYFFGPLDWFVGTYLSGYGELLSGKLNPSAPLMAAVPFFVIPKDIIQPSEKTENLTLDTRLESFVPRLSSNGAVVDRKRLYQEFPRVRDYLNNRALVTLEINGIIYISKKIDRLIIDSGLSTESKLQSYYYGAPLTRESPTDALLAQGLRGYITIIPRMAELYPTLGQLADAMKSETQIKDMGPFLRKEIEEILRKSEIEAGQFSDIFDLTGEQGEATPIYLNTLTRSLVVLPELKGYGTLIPRIAEKWPTVGEYIAGTERGESVNAVGTGIKNKIRKILEKTLPIQYPGTEVSEPEPLTTDSLLTSLERLPKGKRIETLTKAYPTIGAYIKNQNLLGDLDGVGKKTIKIVNKLLTRQGFSHSEITIEEWKRDISIYLNTPTKVLLLHPELKGKVTLVNRVSESWPTIGHYIAARSKDESVRGAGPHFHDKVKKILDPVLVFKKEEVKKEFLTVNSPLSSLGERLPKNIDIEILFRTYLTIGEYIKNRDKVSDLEGVDKKTIEAVDKALAEAGFSLGFYDERIPESRKILAKTSTIIVSIVVAMLALSSVAANGGNWVGPTILVLIFSTVIGAVKIVRMSSSAHFGNLMTELRIENLAERGAFFILYKNTDINILFETVKSPLRSESKRETQIAIENLLIDMPDKIIPANNIADPQEKYNETERSKIYNEIRSNAQKILNASIRVSAEDIAAIDEKKLSNLGIPDDQLSDVLNWAHGTAFAPMDFSDLQTVWLRSSSSQYKFLPYLQNIDKNIQTLIGPNNKPDSLLQAGIDDLRDAINTASPKPTTGTSSSSVQPQVSRKNFTLDDLIKYPANKISFGVRNWHGLMVWWATASKKKFATRDDFKARIYWQYETDVDKSIKDFHTFLMGLLANESVSKELKKAIKELEALVPGGIRNGIAQAVSTRHIFVPILKIPLRLIQFWLTFFIPNRWVDTAETETAITIAWEPIRLALTSSFLVSQFLILLVEGSSPYLLLSIVLHLVNLLSFSFEHPSQGKAGWRRILPPFEPTFVSFLYSVPLALVLFHNAAWWVGTVISIVLLVPSFPLLYRHWERDVWIIQDRLYMDRKEEIEEKMLNLLINDLAIPDLVKEQYGRYGSRGDYFSKLERELNIPNYILDLFIKNVVKKLKDKIDYPLLAKLVNPKRTHVSRLKSAFIGPAQIFIPFVHSDFFKGERFEVNHKENQVVIKRFLFEESIFVGHSWEEKQEENEYSIGDKIKINETLSIKVTLDNGIPILTVFQKKSKANAFVRLNKPIIPSESTPEYLKLSNVPFVKTLSSQDESQLLSEFQSYQFGVEGKKVVLEELFNTPSIDYGFEPKGVNNSVAVDDDGVQYLVRKSALIKVNDETARLAKVDRQWIGGAQREIVIPINPSSHFNVIYENRFFEIKIKGHTYRVKKKEDKYIIAQLDSFGKMIGVPLEFKLGETKRLFPNDGPVIHVVGPGEKGLFGSLIIANSSSEKLLLYFDNLAYPDLRRVLLKRKAELAKEVREPNPAQALSTRYIVVPVVQAILSLWGIFGNASWVNSPETETMITAVWENFRLGSTSVFLFFSGLKGNVLGVSIPLAVYLGNTIIFMLEHIFQIEDGKVRLKRPRVLQLLYFTFVPSSVISFAFFLFYPLFQQNNIWWLIILVKTIIFLGILAALYIHWEYDYPLIKRRHDMRHLEEELVKDMIKRIDDPKRLQREIERDEMRTMENYLKRAVKSSGINVDLYLESWPYRVFSIAIKTFAQKIDTPLLVRLVNHKPTDVTVFTSAYIGPIHLFSPENYFDLYKGTKYEFSFGPDQEIHMKIYTTSLSGFGQYEESYEGFLSFKKGERIQVDKFRWIRFVEENGIPIVRMGQTGNNSSTIVHMNKPLITVDETPEFIRLPPTQNVKLLSRVEAEGLGKQLGSVRSGLKTNIPVLKGRVGQKEIGYFIRPGYYQSFAVEEDGIQYFISPSSLIKIPEAAIKVAKIFGTELEIPMKKIRNMNLIYEEEEAEALKIKVEGRKFSITSNDRNNFSIKELGEDKKARELKKGDVYSVLDDESGAKGPFIRVIDDRQEGLSGSIEIDNPNEIEFSIRVPKVSFQEFFRKVKNEKQNFLETRALLDGMENLSWLFVLQSLFFPVVLSAVPIRRSPPPLERKGDGGRHEPDDWNSLSLWQELIRGLRDYTELKQTLSNLREKLPLTVFRHINDLTRNFDKWQQGKTDLVGEEGLEHRSELFHQLHPYITSYPSREVLLNPSNAQIRYTLYEQTPQTPSRTGPHKSRVDKLNKAIEYLIDKQKKDYRDNGRFQLTKENLFKDVVITGINIPTHFMGYDAEKSDGDFYFIDDTKNIIYLSWPLLDRLKIDNKFQIEFLADILLEALRDVQIKKLLTRFGLTGLGPWGYFLASELGEFNKRISRLGGFVERYSELIETLKEEDQNIRERSFRKRIEELKNDIIPNLKKELEGMEKEAPSPMTDDVAEKIRTRYKDGLFLLINEQAFLEERMGWKKRARKTFHQQLQAILGIQRVDWPGILPVEVQRRKVSLLLWILINDPTKENIDSYLKALEVLTTRAFKPDAEEDRTTPVDKRPLEDFPRAIAIEEKKILLDSVLYPAVAILKTKFHLLLQGRQKTADEDQREKILKAIETTENLLDQVQARIDLRIKFSNLERSKFPESPDIVAETTEKEPYITEVRFTDERDGLDPEEKPSINVKLEISEDKNEMELNVSRNSAGLPKIAKNHLLRLVWPGIRREVNSLSEAHSVDINDKVGDMPYEKDPNELPRAAKDELIFKLENRIEGALSGPFTSGSLEKRFVDQLNERIPTLKKTWPVTMGQIFADVKDLGGESLSIYNEWSDDMARQIKAEVTTAFARSILEETYYLAIEKNANNIFTEQLSLVEGEMTRGHYVAALEAIDAALANIEPELAIENSPYQTFLEPLQRAYFLIDRLEKRKVSTPISGHQSWLGLIYFLNQGYEKSPKLLLIALPLLILELIGLRVVTLTTGPPVILSLVSLSLSAFVVAHLYLRIQLARKGLIHPVSIVIGTFSDVVVLVLYLSNPSWSVIFLHVAIDLLWLMLDEKWGEAKELVLETQEGFQIRQGQQTPLSLVEEILDDVKTELGVNGQLRPGNSSDSKLPKEQKQLRLVEWLEENIQEKISRGEISFYEGMRMSQLISSWVGEEVKLRTYKNVVALVRKEEIETWKKIVAQMPQAKFQIIYDKGDQHHFDKLFENNKENLNLIPVRYLFKGKNIIRSKKFGQALRLAVRKRSLLVYSNQLALDNRYLGLSDAILNKIEFKTFEQLKARVFDNLPSIKTLSYKTILKMARIFSRDA